MSPITLSNINEFDFSYIDQYILFTSKEVEKLENLLYNCMLGGNLLEKRIARLEEAVGLDEETIALEEKIKKLTEYLNHRTKTANTLSGMIDQFMVSC